MLKTLFTLSLVAHSAMATLSIKTIKELHPMEGQNTQLWHGGYLWEGDAAAQKVDVFDSKGTLLRSISMTHFVKYVISAGPNSVLIVGKVYGEGWESYATTIRISDFKTSVRKLSEPVFAHMLLAESPNRFFFGDIPEKSLAHIDGNQLRRFGPEIVVPTEMVKSGNSLWIVEKGGLGSEVYNLMHYDLRTGKAERLFEKSTLRGRLARLFEIKSHNLLAAAETDKNQILLFDMNTRHINSTIAASGSPRALSRYKNCLVVLSEQSRELRFFQLNKANQLLDTWNLESAGFKLTQPQGLDMDETTGNAFVRSSIGCTLCTASPNSVVLVEETNHAAIDKCSE